MARNTSVAQKWIKSGVAALGAAALMLPLANAMAVAVDPTQAAPAEEAASTLSAEQIEQGRQLFNDWSCSACHVLTDAGGNGHIGPSLDGNVLMDAPFIEGRIANGQGSMPGFAGQMSDEEISLLATYIMEAKR